MKKILVLTFTLSLIGTATLFAQTQATGAAAPAAAASTTTPAAKPAEKKAETVATKTVVGVIESVKAANAEKKTAAVLVVAADGAKINIHVPSAAKIKDASGASAKFAALKAGDKVSVTYKGKNTQAVSISIVK